MKKKIYTLIVLFLVVGFFTTDTFADVEVIWQIGVFNQKKSELKNSGLEGISELDFYAGVDPDSEFPSVLFYESLESDYRGVNKVNIHFTLDIPYTDVHLIYGRAGDETDVITLGVGPDAVTLATITGIENSWEGSPYDIPIGDLFYGDHVISIEVIAGGTLDDFHIVDALQLIGTPDMPYAEITKPEEGEVISGSVLFEAIYLDFELGEIRWAVRKGNCEEPANTVFGNIDGFNDPFTFDGELFQAVADTSSWEEDDYCFVFDPLDSLETSGLGNLYLTQINALLAPNHPPVANDDSYSTDEDTVLSVAAPGVMANDSDPDGDPLTAILDSGPTDGMLTFNSDGSFTYTPDADFCGMDGFAYSISDGEGETASAAVTITVNCVNDPPEISVGTLSVTVDEGDVALNFGTYFEAEGDTVQFSASKGTVMVDGPGTWAWVFQTTDGPTDSDTIIITADDGNGGIATASFTLTVNNVPPTVAPISVSHDFVSVGIPIVATSAFSDPGTGDTHTAVWNWGDTTSETQFPAQGAISARHTYTTAGLYRIEVTVTDDDGGVGSSFYEYVFVFDPARFVTGGGWIDSPAGAYLPDPTLTGKATFGFVSKYRRNATVPRGNVQFQFRAGGLNFHASSHDWLLVNGDGTAIFTGTGTINGQGEYRFMIWAGDGEVDTFRLKIWQETETGAETVIYDNGFDQELGGGSIVVRNRTPRR
jgi:hypothetical protein